jgi:hypothetical protein
MNLLEKKESAILTATFWFKELMKLSNEIRNDDKERTGIQVFAWEPGTRNFIYFPVGEPSEAAQIFSVEKAVRSYVLGDAASQNSQNISISRFPGSVTVIINGVTILVSVSGLQSHEDVFVAIQVLSGIFNETTASICLNVVEKGGRLPTFNHWYENQLL